MSPPCIEISAAHTEDARFFPPYHIWAPNWDFTPFHCASDSPAWLYTEKTTVHICVHHDSLINRAQSNAYVYLHPAPPTIS